MTRQQFIAILIGVLFCCCLLGKQTVQSYDNLIDQPAAQEVVVESLDSDDLVDVTDDFLVIPFLFAAIYLFFVAPTLSSLTYSQPTIRSPRRPPSI
jgi:hypothetical protein